MHNIVAVVVALSLAAILWRLLRWTTRHSNVATKDKEEVPVDKLTSPCDNARDTNATTQTSLTRRRPSENADLMQRSPAEQIGETKHPNADETTTDILQLELCQERTLRVRAEDWAEFLALELEAHIRARIEAERRCDRLERKLNSVNPGVLTGNKNKPASRNFKSIGEARQTWQNTCDLRNKEQEPECLAREPDHDETEWLQIVDVNIRILQTTNAYNKQKDETTTNSHKAKELCHRGNVLGLSKDSNIEDLKANLITITVEESISPGEEQKTLERTPSEVSDNKNYEDFAKLRTPFHGHQNLKDERIPISNIETNQSDEAEIDKNPLVCTDSLSNIKETTEKWENLSALKETLGSPEDLSPLSPDPAGKKGLLHNDITQGLVKKNQKLYETCEAAEKVEDH